MKEIITDLFGHQAWADAEMIKAVGKNAKAVEDKIIHDRLNHSHQAQRAFLQVAGKEKLDHGKLKDIDAWEELKKSIISYHESALSFVNQLTDSHLEETADIPWLGDPPLVINICELLLQAAMHTHQHRAQNASRLRELGGEPPTVDLIMWYWKGRPKPVWE